MLCKSLNGGVAFQSKYCVSFPQLYKYFSLYHIAAETEIMRKTAALSNGV